MRYTEIDSLFDDTVKECKRLHKEHMINLLKEINFYDTDVYFGDIKGRLEVKDSFRGYKNEIAFRPYKSNGELSE